MSIETNKAVVRRIMEEVWNGWNLAAASDLFAPDFVDHVRPSDHPPGLAGLEQVFHEWRAAFPDWHIDIDALIGEDDLVVARLTAGGTHRGVYEGIAPTGKRVTLTAIEIFRVVEGKVVEFWANLDELGMLRQLGAIPLM